MMRSCVEPLTPTLPAAHRGFSAIPPEHDVLVLSAKTRSTVSPATQGNRSIGYQTGYQDFGSSGVVVQGYLIAFPLFNNVVPAP